MRSVRLNAWATPLVGLAVVIGASGQPDICQQATNMFRERRWAEAAEEFAQCEKSSARQTDALLFRGKALVNQSRYTLASEAIEAYLAIHPQSDGAIYLLGFIRFRQGRPRESLDLFTRAAELKDPGADDLKIVALDYVLLADYASAAHYLEESIQMNPEDVEARYHLGRVRYQQNRFDQAIAAFEEVLRRKPGDVKAEENLALCLEGKNQVEPAIAAYRRAIEYDAAAAIHNEQPYLDFGQLLTTLNRGSEALPLLERAVAISPNSATAHYELGRALFGMQKAEEARLQLEQAVSLDPTNSSRHYLLGRIYKRMGKLELAAQQFKMTEQLILQQNARSGGMANRPSVIVPEPTLQ